jgi:hypothetical protein
LRGLDRIVAGLIFLAGLAVHAAAAPRPVRRAMLWGLRRADARVKDFAARYAFWMGLPPRPVVMVFDGNDRDAALSLALSLRMLAFAIADMIARLRRRQFLFSGQATMGSFPASRPRHLLTVAGDSPDSRVGIPDTS